MYFIYVLYIYIFHIFFKYIFYLLFLYYSIAPRIPPGLKMIALGCGLERSLGVLGGLGAPFGGSVTLLDANMAEKSNKRLKR